MLEAKYVFKKKPHRKKIKYATASFRVSEPVSPRVSGELYIRVVS